MTSNSKQNETPDSPATDSQESPSTDNASVDSEQSTALVKKLDDELSPVLGDKQERETVIGKIVSIFRAEIFRGPVPHPKHFAQYEKACPGSGSRIIGMAETALTRAEDRNDAIVEHEYHYQLVGLYLAAGVLVAFLIAGVILCVSGHEYVGTAILGLSGLTTIASRFIDGKQKYPTRSGDKAAAAKK
ncbi:MAG TPA: DUF2335 domain-containing protein [Hyphomicrobium sp.]|nr:DUF2335 domain-containing protein [Hyphomicrobium sp.]